MNLVIIANCFAFEIKRSLLQHSSFAKSCEEVDIVSTYLNEEAIERSLEKIKRADLIIAQNPKKGHWAYKDNLSRHLKNSAIYIQTEFWRFNGFWPIKGTRERLNPHFWFPNDEYGLNLSFSDYINMEIEKDLIKSNFNEQLEKFIDIDKKSDVSMLDYFIENYQNTRVLSDEWHPYPCFFKTLSVRILNHLGYQCEIDIPELRPMGINNDRHRLIPKAVLDCLNMDENVYHADILYFGKRVSLNQYYNFSKLVSKLGMLESIKTQVELKTLYFEFLKQQ